MYAATASGLFVSADTGRTWKPEVGEGTGQSIDTLVEDGRTIYAMAGNTPYALIGTGSWVSLCPADSGSVACPDSLGKPRLAAFDSGIVLIRPSGAYQSGDQGVTWRVCDHNPALKGPIFRTWKGLYYFDDNSSSGRIVRVAGSGVESASVGLPSPAWLPPCFSCARVNVVSDSLIALHFQEDRVHGGTDTTNPYYSMVSRNGGKTWTRMVLGWSPNRGLAQADSEIYFIDKAGSLRRGWDSLSASLPPKPPVAGSGFTALAFAYGNLLAADSAGRILILPPSEWHHDRIEHSLRIDGRTYGKFADRATPTFRGEAWLSPGDTLRIRAEASYMQYNYCEADPECWKQYTQVFQSWHAIGKAEILPDTLSPAITFVMGTEDVRLEPLYESELFLRLGDGGSPAEPAARLTTAGLTLRIPGGRAPTLRIRLMSMGIDGRGASAELELQGSHGDYSIPLSLIPGGAESVRKGLRYFRVQWAEGSIRWVQSFL